MCIYLNDADWCWQILRGLIRRHLHRFVPRFRLRLPLQTTCYRRRRDLWHPRFNDCRSREECGFSWFSTDDEVNQTSRVIYSKRPAWSAGWPVADRPCRREQNSSVSNVVQQDGELPAPQVSLRVGLYQDNASHVTTAAWRENEYYALWYMHSTEPLITPTTYHNQQPHAHTRSHTQTWSNNLC